MRLHEREQHVPLLKTELAIKLHEYQEKKDLTDVAMLQAVAAVKVKILKAMRRQGEFIAEPDKRRFTVIDRLVYEHARESYPLTDIEILQALADFELGKLKYMLRYERHGNYETPGGLTKE